MLTSVVFNLKINKIYFENRILKLSLLTKQIGFYITGVHLEFSSIMVRVGTAVSIKKVEG